MSNTYRWRGAPEAIATLAEGHTDVLGPVVLDGVGYVEIVTTDVLAVPEGVEEIGPQLAARTVGVWMEEE